MSTRRRLLVALATTLLLLLLAWVCPADGGQRGPALLSILGKWHLLALHLPAALIFVLPVLEWLNPSEEPSRPVRHLADIAAAGTWLAAVLGMLHGHFNGFEGTDVDRHLQLGVLAAAVSALAWALMNIGRTRRIALQCLAALTVVLAAHTGGEMVHGEGFLNEPSQVKETSSLTDPAERGFSPLPSATAAENTDTAGFAPSAENEKLPDALKRELPVRAYWRADKANMGLNVHATDKKSFGDETLGKLGEKAGPQVAILFMGGTQLTDGCAASLACFTRVEALFMFNTRVGDPTAEAIAAKTPSIRLLHLSGTGVTDKGLAALAKCPNLDELYLDKTSCTPEGIAAFCKARPKALVVKDGKFYGDTTIPTGK